MSKERDNIPQADLLMGSMRSMGYSFEAAIADVIDNSISADCENIHLLFPTDRNEELTVGILDDGYGMGHDELFEAMRYGSTASEQARRENDLGRFGLGMKSASLSQCRILTVVSIKDAKISAYTWDYNIIQKRKKWVVLELTQLEIDALPYINLLKEQKKGTLVLWSDFDALYNSSDGQVYDTLMELRIALDQYLSLIFHRYLGANHKLSIFINNYKLKPLDPFLENHPKTTTKRERVIAIKDTSGVERHVHVSPFILPYVSDLSEKDQKLLGGVENLRQKQGFYVYRNQRLIIWGTWFGMRTRGELSKNARIRVDIPNTLDDIWNIDIKKQNATIPKRIQNQLKQTVNDVFEISTRQQTYRGRKESVDDNVEYVWARMKGRNEHYFYQINRESNLYKIVREKLSDENLAYFDMFVNEVEKNFPIQQLYVDKSQEVVDVVESEDRAGELYELGVTIITSMHKAGLPLEEAIKQVLNMEQYINNAELKKKLTNHFKDEH